MTNPDTDFIEMVSKTQKCLKENQEWVERYSEYIDAIKKQIPTIKEKKANFKEWAPLYLYMTVTEAKSSMTFGLRYRGQDVAKLSVDENNSISISTEKFNASNLRDFTCDIELDKNNWKSKEASQFRQHFIANPERTTNANSRNEEHRIESLLVTEFSKNNQANKLLLNVQPVKLEGFARFQMPTPLKASTTNAISLASSPGRGGGIDILCRIGTGRGTNLCVLEVKDENKFSEPPRQAAMQGLAYAVFLRELLRSKSGKDWWRFFGFIRDLPENLDIYVASAMPAKDNDDLTFSGQTITVPGEDNKDSFHLHSLSFQEEDNELLNINTTIKQCVQYNAS